MMRRVDDHAKSQTKTIHLVRHGESQNNAAMGHAAAEILNIDLGRGMPSVPNIMSGRHGAQVKETLVDVVLQISRENPDPCLTPLGMRQAEALRFDNATVRASVNLLVVSSLRRALHTASLGFGDLLEKGQARAVAIDDARELLMSPPMDTRRPTSEIRLDPACASSSWDLSRLPEIPTDPATPEGHCRDIYDLSNLDMRQVWSRGLRVLEFIMAQPESAVALVAHGGFLKYGVLLNPCFKWSPADRAMLLQRHLKNCDCVSISITPRRSSEKRFSRGNKRDTPPVYDAKVIAPWRDGPAAATEHRTDARL